MSSREAAYRLEIKEGYVTTKFDVLLASTEFSLTLVPFAGKFEPSIWAQLPAEATIEDLDDVLDYLGSHLDGIAADEPGWLVENEKWSTRKGRSALVVPASDVERAMQALRQEFGLFVTEEPKQP